ncbi:MAG: methyltransferase [Anaerolineae bacterium]|nr:methyltransferase [Anaerolineae bacterium]
MADGVLPVLSHFQAEPLLKAHRAGEATAITSLDLGLTTVEVTLGREGVAMLSGGGLDWATLTVIAADNVGCYTIEGGEAVKAQQFSEMLNRMYSLMPTRRAPTMLISGIPMHRVKDVDPTEDTRRKIRAANPRGRVLDTATGLGYTAIEAARTADHVTTIEIDPTALAMARLNPWSRSLFDNPKIQQVIGDSFDVVASLPDENFSVIVHDPPIMSLAGDLYSKDMYAELYRILRRSGRLFHYIGDPDGKMGANVTRGATRRLLDAGFARVERRPEAFGVVAYKER